MRRALALSLGALGFFTVLAGAYTWPLARHLGTHFPVRQVGLDAPVPDQLLTAWLMSHDARALLHDPRDIFESNNLYPFRHTLAYAENMIGMAALIAPVHVAAANPTLNHNVATLLGIVLGGFGTYLLVRELSGSALAGLVAGAFLVYAPIVWANLLLLQMIAGQWVPVALLALVRTVRTRRLAWALALGGSAALQVWTSLHHGLFLGIGLVATTGVLLALSRAARRAVPQLAIGGILGLALSLPVVLPYRQVARELDLGDRPGAVGMSLALSDIAPPWRRPLAYFGERLRNGARPQRLASLTPWILATAGLIAAGAARRPRAVDPPVLVALAAGGLANLLVATGPVPHPWLPSLYPLLAAWVPGFGTLRAPMRAATYTYLVISVFAGVGLGALLRRLAHPATRVAAATGALALLAIEAGWGPIPLVPAPPPPAVLPLLERLEAGCPIAELPTGLVSGAVALYRSTSHWHPLVTGYSGLYPVPPGVTAAFLSPFPGGESLSFLAEAGACAVVVRPDVGTAATERIAAASRARGLVVEAAGGELLVSLPRPPAEPPLGPRLPRDGWRAEAPTATPAALVLDGDLETVWRGVLHGDDGPARLVLDLGATREPAAIDLELGHRFRLYLETYRIEGSSDGERWIPLAESPLAVPPLASYRADFRAVRQRLALRRASVRWVRVGPFREPPRGGLAADAAWQEWGAAEAYLRAPATTASTR